MPNKIIIDKDGKLLSIRTLTQEQMNGIVALIKTEFPEAIIPEDLLGKLLPPIKKGYAEDLCWDETMPRWEIRQELRTQPLIEVQVARTSGRLKVLNQILAPQKITERTRGIIYPKRPDEYSRNWDNSVWTTNDNPPPKYPIYIISKGRWEKRQTSRYLDWANIPYRIVIEPQEREQYIASGIDPSNILILPDEYLNKGQGGIPARNFVWRHSTAEGHNRHWILDDNISHYERMFRSERVIAKGSFVFRFIEDYIDTYQNIKMAGHNYRMFVIPTNTRLGPIIKNTRIYSSILLSNDIPSLLGCETEGMWRGKYNEDVDLSCRVLKAGLGTALFNVFPANKETTMWSKGGNTSSIYNVEDYALLKAQSLLEQHPDITHLINRFGRIHHSVNYLPFKNIDWKRLPIEEREEPKGEYGMYLTERPKTGLFAPKKNLVKVYNEENAV